MKRLALTVLALVFSLSVAAADGPDEKPIQHLNVPAVSSMQEAKEIFIDKTVDIRRKRPVSLETSAQIHVITYTLEKSVAYFADNLTGEKQDLAKELAVVVEEIHLSSERNRLAELEGHLDQYFSLVDRFLFGF
jgi:hypothetical protein